jgi:hypothetical protein
MTRRAFDALDDASLARAAVEPIIVAVKAKSPGIKSAVYEALSPSRRALFAFWIVYGHAREQGWTRFFREVPYLSAFPDFFDCLRSTFKYIGDEAMLTLVSDVEHVYGAHGQVMKDLTTLDSQVSPPVPEGPLSTDFTGTRVPPQIIVTDTVRILRMLAARVASANERSTMFRSGHVQWLP